MSYIKKYSYETMPQYWHNFLKQTAKNKPFNLWDKFRMDELSRYDIAIVDHIWANFTVDFKTEENYFLFKIRYS